MIMVITTKQNFVDGTVISQPEQRAAATAQNFYITAIEEGIADAAAGNLTDLDVVEAYWADTAVTL